MRKAGAGGGGKQDFVERVALALCFVRAWGERFKANWGGVTWGMDKTPRHADLFRHPWHKEKISFPDVRKQAKDYAKVRAAKLESGELDLTKEAEERAAKKATEMESRKRRWLENEEAEKARKKAKEAAEAAAKEREERAKQEAKQRAAEQKAAAKAAAEAAKSAPAAAGQWVEYKDPQGRPYYYNTATKETKWEKPAEGFMQAAPAPETTTSAQPTTNSGNSGSRQWDALDAARSRQAQQEPQRQPQQQSFGNGGGGPMGGGGGFGGAAPMGRGGGGGRGRDLTKPAWMVAKEREEAQRAGQ